MSFTGLIAEIPLGPDGLTGNRNLTQVAPTALLQAENVTYESGSIRKEGGATKYNSSAISGTPVVLAGWDWFPTVGTQRMVVYTNAGKLLKDSGSGAFAVTLATGLNTTAVPVFVEAGAEALANNRKLFCFNGADPVQVLSGDGATTSALALPPADWSGAVQPISGCAHEGRLWGALQHRVYYSTAGNHEDFIGAGSGNLAVFPGEGEKIVQIMSFKGLLIVWKFPVGIYLIDTSSATVANWRVTRISGTIGGVSPLCATMIDDNVLFVDQGANVQLLSGIQEFGQVGSDDLTHIHLMAPFIRSNVSLNRLDKVRTAFYAHKREAHIAVTAAGQTVNTARLVVDFNRPGVPRFRWSPRDICESLWLRKDISNIPRPVCGDNAGFVWLLDQDTRSKASLGYTSKFQTPHTDFSFLDPALATKRKNGKFLELVVDPIGNWDISVDVIWDGKTVQTVEFNLGVSGAQLGTFVLGLDQLGATSIIARKHRIVGSGRRLSLIMRNSGVGQDFSVARAFLYFTPADEQTRN